MELYMSYYNSRKFKDIEGENVLNDMVWTVIACRITRASGGLCNVLFERYGEEKVVQRNRAHNVRAIVIICLILNFICKWYE